MEDDLEPGPETHPKRWRLNAREQQLAAILIGVAILVCILVLSSRFL